MTGFLINIAPVFHFGQKFCIPARILKWCSLSTINSPVYSKKSTNKKRYAHEPIAVQFVRGEDICTN